MSQRYEIDRAHSVIGFNVRHLVVTTVRGQFQDFAGFIEVEDEDPATARAEVTVKTASINTNTPDRDAHLRSADFFESETFPEMRFVSSSITPRGGERYLVEGDLTIKDVTRPVELEATLTGTVQDPYGNERRGLSLRGSLNRKDWGLAWNKVVDAGTLMLGDTINLEIDVAAVRPLAVAA